MGIIDSSDAVRVCTYSTFMKAYSRRGRKGGLSDREARVGRADRRSYKLGWRSHTLVSMKALSITYIVRAANVNDKVKGEKRLVELYKRRMPVERAFKASKLELSMAICYSCTLAVVIVAHKMGRPELANNIAAFKY